LDVEPNWTIDLGLSTLDHGHWTVTMKIERFEDIETQDSQESPVRSPESKSQRAREMAQIKRFEDTEAHDSQESSVRSREPTTGKMRVDSRESRVRSQESRVNCLEAKRHKAGVERQLPKWLT